MAVYYSDNSVHSSLGNMSLIRQVKRRSTAEIFKEFSVIQCIGITLQRKGKRIGLAGPLTRQQLLELQDLTYLNIPVEEPPQMLFLPYIYCLAAPGHTGTDSFPKMSPLFLIGFQSTVRQIRLLSGRQAPCWHNDARNDGSRSLQNLLYSERGALH